VCFDDYEKNLGNEDWIDNLLEDLKLSKHQFFSIGRGMSNSLEMLWSAHMLESTAYPVKTALSIGDF